MKDDVTRASRFLAYVLRHDPGSIGLALGDGGWVPVGELLAGAARHGQTLDAATIDRVLAAPPAFIGPVGRPAQPGPAAQP